MNELHTAYLAAVLNGDEATATELLDRIEAETDAQLSAVEAELGDLLIALDGLSEAAEELATA